MTRLHWHEAARRDIDAIARYFAEHDPRIAALIVERIEAAAAALAQRDTGRPGRMSGLREKSVPRTSYIVAYERLNVGDEVETFIHRIIHSARDWPKGETPP